MIVHKNAKLKIAIEYLLFIEVAEYGFPYNPYLFKMDSGAHIFKHNLPRYCPSLARIKDSLLLILLYSSSSFISDVLINYRIHFLLLKSMNQP